MAGRWKCGVNQSDKITGDGIRATAEAGCL